MIQVLETLGIWFTGVVALLLAVFGDALRSARYHAELRLRIPDRYPVKTFFGNSPGDIDVYYTHIMVENVGNQRADEVEVLVERIEAVQQDGSTRLVGIESPANLPLALGAGKLSRTIHKSLVAYFDIGHVTDPSMRQRIQPAEATPDILPNETCFVMEYPIRPKLRDHVLRKGTYRLHVVAAAKNARTQRCVVQLDLTGRWAGTEVDMRRDGIGMKIV